MGEGADMILEVLKMTVPISIGLGIWCFQTLAQRAWNDFDRRRELYVDIAGQISSLFEGGTRDETLKFLNVTRKLRLVGSDEVVIALNNLTKSIRNGSSHEDRERFFRQLMLTMRKDLFRRAWLPPKNTRLQIDDFLLEGANRRPNDEAPRSS